MESALVRLAQAEARLATLEGAAGASAPAPSAAPSRVPKADGLAHRATAASDSVDKAASLMACQRDSQLREVETCVLSCEAAKAPADDAKKKKKKKKGKAEAPPQQLYRVQVEDNVIFPAGGGQPSDRGTVDGVDVLDAYREAGQVFLTTATPLEVGKSVRVVTDWERRFEHMQHHSAQHLISALALRDFGAPTLSWELGASSPPTPRLRARCCSRVGCARDLLCGSVPRPTRPRSFLLPVPRRQTTARKGHGVSEARMIHGACRRRLRGGHGGSGRDGPEGQRHVGAARAERQRRGARRQRHHVGTLQPGGTQEGARHRRVAGAPLAPGSASCSSQPW